MTLVYIFIDQLQQIKKWHQKVVIVFMFYHLYLIYYQKLIGKQAESYKNKIIEALENTILPKLSKNY